MAGVARERPRRGHRRPGRAHWTAARPGQARPPAVESPPGRPGTKPIPANRLGEVRRRRGRASCTADDPPACTVVKGAGPHVLLVGDSQAQMLVPMFEKLANEQDLTLSLNVLAGCPWQEGLSKDKQSPDRTREVRGGAGRLVRRGAAQAPPRRRGAARSVPATTRRSGTGWSSVVTARSSRSTRRHETSRETLAKVAKVADETVVVERMVMPETFDPTMPLLDVRTGRPVRGPGAHRHRPQRRVRRHGRRPRTRRCSRST